MCKTQPNSRPKPASNRGPTSGMPVSRFVVRMGKVCAAKDVMPA